MTTQTLSTARSQLGSIVLALTIGLGLVFAAGFAQSQTLHDAAHDLRHSTGFPCH